MVPLFRNVLPTPYVAALVLVVGLDPFFWQFKDHVLSDLPFLFFVLLSLLLFTQADAPMPHLAVAQHLRCCRALRPTRPTPPGHWR